MAWRIVFTDSGFWKCSWTDLIIPMTESCRWEMQCHLRARRPRASNKGPQPCPLCTDNSQFSLNLLMLCTVAFAIWHWGTLFLKYSFYRLGSRDAPIDWPVNVICRFFAWPAHISDRPVSVMSCQFRANPFIASGADNDGTATPTLSRV